MRDIYGCLIFVYVFKSVCSCSCTFVGLSNPPTDLVCKAGSDQGHPGFSKPQIELSWKAPVPNGGRPRIYEVELYGYFKQLVESTNYVVSLESDGQYYVYVWVVDSNSCCSVAICEVDTRERCE